jgi:2-C-methyl-D-erythritol 4-phosphate cytidylyltransferase
MRVATVVLAAGTSQRFGGRPKQFEQLGDSTVLQYAVRAFLDVDRVAEVWVVTSAAHELATRTLLGGDKITGFVLGGDTRAASTIRALDALDPSVTHVLVHDAARPLLPRATVERCLDALEVADVVATVVPAADTVVVLDETGAGVDSMPDRQRVRLHQTPQGFRRDLLADAWARLAGKPPSTDDVTAVLRAFPEQTVAWVDGDLRTVKVTHPDDLAVVRALAADWDPGHG